MTTQDRAPRQSGSSFIRNAGEPKYRRGLKNHAGRTFAFSDAFRERIFAGLLGGPKLYEPKPLVPPLRKA
jgi:hypothetical protein